MIIWPVVLFLIVLSVLIAEIIRKNIHIWIIGYIKHCFMLWGRRPVHGPTHIFFCIVDHFEPAWNKVSIEEERKRVDFWVNNYPKLADSHKDSDGKCPQYTFFYPFEEYRPEHINKLAGLCEAGYAEVEVHLHHAHDTSAGLRRKIEEFKKILSGHGLLSVDSEGMTRYGFIHGNWALDNSRHGGQWCGVNDELTVLKETGCYADFTLPSAPCESQTGKINSIYYAFDDPARPKSHDQGVDVTRGKPSVGDLMIIQGPLTFDWIKRKLGIFPRIENGKIESSNLPDNHRVDLWIKQAISVKGQDDCVFVKVYTHGCQENNFDVLLGAPMDKMFTYLETKYNDGSKYLLHYVTAREVYNIVKSIEGGTGIKGGRNAFLKRNMRS
ncbi:MAG: hypothetical protein A4E56_01836 [Pelotomaculum sp. PtaU1.Bin065]|nr:MAG: hypothetical protein A4E56_01836 [Pelotomaculum sp. PtaU1.Bin065]